ncbi:MAG: NAD-dependent epimerase/dehydratase family protein [Anaerolineae bacterium]
MGESSRVLVTGGAGFIGSYLVDALVQRGHHVRVFDSLEPQVHGPSGEVPEYLNPAAELVVGDVRDRAALMRGLDGISVVFHYAAAVGVGQSMYEIRRYVEANTLGGANLLDILANEEHGVEKVIVASSMSIYGEGKYDCGECGVTYPQLRSDQQLRERKWEMRCPHCGRAVRPLPTDENKPLYPSSIYAVTKRDHEEMFLCYGRAYRIPTVALRFFNVYGPRQALSNPYTGVAAIFSARLLNHQPPVIYEDGLQSRDFIHVQDVIRASLLAMERVEADYEVFNVGTGRPLTISQIARVLIDSLADAELEPEVAGRYRRGDIRHCFADIGKIEERLGFAPQVSFEDGISDLISWVKEQRVVDKFDVVAEELADKFLVL